MRDKLDITGRTRLVSLIGSPVDHSGSPAIHNYSFDKLGIDAAYLALDVKEQNVCHVLKAMRSVEGWIGSNVTMPCKRAVIDHLDEIDDVAEMVDAVNVISSEGGRLKGYNTDGAGFMTNLRKHGVEIEGATMLIMGAGGAGTAIMAQAAAEGVESLLVFVRKNGESFRRAQTLAERIHAKTDCRVQIHDIEDAADLEACIGKSSILVNATNVGMGSSADDSLVDRAALRPGLAVADVIYFPRETRLIRDAKEAGCKVVPGLGMLLEQAAASEMIWFGVEMPLQEIKEAHYMNCMNFRDVQIAQTNQRTRSAHQALSPSTRQAATTSAMSRTLKSDPCAATPSVSIVKQKGQAVQASSAPVSIA